MPQFEEKESFQHKYAKELLHKWLTENWDGVDRSANNTIKFIDEETENPAHLIASQADFIFMEYPITPVFPLLIDENSSCSQVKGINCKYRSTEKYCPCLHCSKFNKFSLEYVADIATEHKGSVGTIIEVTHKNSTSIPKQQRLKECYSAFEIQASHIMGQIKKPDRLFVRTF